MVTQIGDARFSWGKSDGRRGSAELLLEEIHNRALAQRGLRRSDFVAYVLSHWQGWTKLLNEAAVPLDNNPAERALRELIVGRENDYGSRS